MRVYGYLRLSRPSIDEMADQHQQVSCYADRQGFRLSEILVDVARPIPIPLASRDLGRRLLGLLAPGDAVITPGLDSMFPSARDALATMADLSADGIALHVVELGCDVCRLPLGPKDHPVGLFHAPRRRDTEENRSLKRHLAIQGPYRGGPVPFGFDAVKGSLVPRPDEYDVLRRMIALRIAGCGWGRIAHEVGLEEKQVLRIFQRTDRLLGPARGGSRGVPRLGAPASSPAINHSGQA